MTVGPVRATLGRQYNRTFPFPEETAGEDLELHTKENLPGQVGLGPRDLRFGQQ